MLGSFGGNISNTVAPLITQTGVNQPGNQEKITQQALTHTKSEAASAHISNPSNLTNQLPTPPLVPGTNGGVGNGDKNVEIIGNNSQNAEETQDQNAKIDQSKAELSDEDQKAVRQMQQRDAEVKAHEAAHQSAGGGLTGGASYSYETGPDGQRYVTSGEVGIDISKESDPKATINKMQQVKAAAMAPADPSSADRAVAASASKIEAQAKAELAAAEKVELQEKAEAQKSEKIEDKESTSIIDNSDSTTAKISDKTHQVSEAYQPIQSPDVNQIVNELV